jgi:hypothetical protein
MKASKVQEIIRKKLKDMTPTKRERFLSTCEKLIKGGEQARRLREGL